MDKVLVHPISDERLHQPGNWSDPVEHEHMMLLRRPDEPGALREADAMLAHSREPVCLGRYGGLHQFLAAALALSFGNSDGAQQMVGVMMEHSGPVSA